MENAYFFGQMENAFGSKIPKQVYENAKYKFDILIVSFENDPELFSLFFLRNTGYKIDKVMKCSHFPFATS